jgi:molybdopterin converting factor subunit 1
VRNPTLLIYVKGTEVKIKIKFFALYKDWTGDNELEIDVKENATVNQVIESLKEKYSKLKTPRIPMQIALNQEFLQSFDVNLHEGDELAFIPPVSGG